jgi:hypothetical protein
MRRPLPPELIGLQPDQGLWMLPPQVAAAKVVACTEWPAATSYT